MTRASTTRTALAFLLVFGTAACEEGSDHIVHAEFTIDSVGANAAALGGSSLTKDEIDDLNLTVEMHDDFIIIPTGIAVAFTAAAQYVFVPKDEAQEFLMAEPWVQRTNWDSTNPPSDEELVIEPVGAGVGVEIVNNQDENDDRARWVIWGMEEGSFGIIVSGTQSESSYEVPVTVVYQ